jgi:hypothetical protein
MAYLYNQDLSRAVAMDSLWLIAFYVVVWEIQMEQVEIFYQQLVMVELILVSIQEPVAANLISSVLTPVSDFVLTKHL